MDITKKNNPPLARICNPCIILKIAIYYTVIHLLTRFIMDTGHRPVPALCRLIICLNKYFSNYLI